MAPKSRKANVQLARKAGVHLARKSNVPVAHKASVQFADPAGPGGAQVTSPHFLAECRQSALARFRKGQTGRVTCRTVKHVVPAKAGDVGSTGMIVAHLSKNVCAAWDAALGEEILDKDAHIDAEIHVVLEGLADQDMHGYLALTKEQCAFYAPDLVQLVHESLERSSFSKVNLRSDPRWEGTMVGRVQPPYLVLVISIDLAADAAEVHAAPTPRPKRRRKK